MSRYYLYIFLLLISACSSINKPRSSVELPEAQLESYNIRQDQYLTLAAVGDMMLGGTATPYLQKSGYRYPFAETSRVFEKSDILLGNLETSLTNRETLLVEKKYRFKNPPDKVAAALKAVGFDIVSLANNHSLDYGVEGLQDTLQVLNDYGIKAHGAGMNLEDARAPVVFKMDNGQSIGFLAYSNTFPQEFWAGSDRAGTAFGHEHYVRVDVAALHNEVDMVVVSFHWGQEGSTQLRDYQPLLAHAAIDAGADLVIGHHPHILQAVEHYRDGLILYSLGNYVFGSFSNRVFSSVIANITFKNGKVDALHMTPINVNNFQTYFQPAILRAEAARSVFEELYQMSLLRNTKLQYKDELIYYQVNQQELQNGRTE